MRQCKAKTTKKRIDREFAATRSSGRKKPAAHRERRHPHSLKPAFHGNCNIGRTPMHQKKPGFIMVHILQFIPGNTIIIYGIVMVCSIIATISAGKTALQPEPAAWQKVRDQGLRNFEECRNIGCADEGSASYVPAFSRQIRCSGVETMRFLHQRILFRHC